MAACGHVSATSQSLRFILSLRMNSSFITSRPGELPTDVEDANDDGGFVCLMLYVPVNIYGNVGTVSSPNPGGDGDNDDEGVHIIQVSNIWIQVMPNIFSGLIWIKTVCKSNQQTTLAGQGATYSASNMKPSILCRSLPNHPPCLKLSTALCFVLWLIISI